MRAVMFLSCLACAGHARRLFMTEHQPSQRKALGRLLMMLDPPAAWTGGGPLASGISRRAADPRLQKSDKRNKSALTESETVAKLFNKQAQAKLDAIEEAKRTKERGMNDAQWANHLEFEEKIRKAKEEEAKKRGGTSDQPVYTPDPSAPNMYDLPTDRYSDRVPNYDEELSRVPERPKYAPLPSVKDRYASLPGLEWLDSSRASAGVSGGGGFNILNQFAGLLFTVSAVSFVLDRKGYFDNIGAAEVTELTKTVSDLAN